MNQTLGLQVEHDGSTGTSSASRFLARPTGKHQWFSGANCVARDMIWVYKKNLGGRFKHFYSETNAAGLYRTFSRRKLGKIPILTPAYFSDGLVQTPTRNKFIHVDGAMRRRTMFVVFLEWRSAFSSQCCVPGTHFPLNHDGRKSNFSVSFKFRTVSFEKIPLELTKETILF